MWKSSVKTFFVKNNWYIAICLYLVVSFMAILALMSKVMWNERGMNVFIAIGQALVIISMLLHLIFDVSKWIKDKKKKTE